MKEEKEEEVERYIRENIAQTEEQQQNEELAAVLARVDERTKRTNEILERIISERISPLEDEVEVIDNRSRRNEVVLSAIVTAITVVGAWSLDLLPV